MLYNFADCRLDTNRQELRRGSDLVAVEPQVLDLLIYLIRNRDRVVSKDDLVANVWNGRLVSDSTLTSRITTARKAIGDSGQHQRLIRTIARKGLRFIAMVREQQNGDYADAATPMPEPDSVLGRLLGTTPRFPDKPSIAVLPFTNMSGDPEQQYFSDGITEDITTDLSRFRQLFVIARHSSFQYRDHAIDVKRVGRELGVEYVVEGSVRRIGERVRITAQLVDAITGNHLWAERYDRDLKEIFAVQDDVVRIIVAILPGRIDEAGSRSARRKRPENLAAYDYFLRGAEYHLMFDTAHNVVAREMFENAIALDPQLAPAYAWLATQHMRDWMLYQSVEAREQAFRLAEQAVALDPNDSVCHMMLGYVCLYQKQFDDAEFHLKQAINLNPNDPNNAVTMGWFAACVGRPDEGLNWMDRAYRLNPYPPRWYYSIHGSVLYAARRYSDAVVALKRVAVSLEPWDVTYLAASFGRLGLAGEAQTIVARTQSLYPRFSMSQYVASEPFRDPEDIAHLREGLKKAGILE
jgi:adenylate cyclase